MTITEKYAKEIIETYLELNDLCLTDSEYKEAEEIILKKIHSNEDRLMDEMSIFYNRIGEK